MDLKSIIQDQISHDANLVRAAAAQADDRYITPLLCLEREYRKALQEQAKRDDCHLKAPTTLHLAIEAAIALLPDRRFGG